jgi:GT2 family glycosyltransferase
MIANSMSIRYLVWMIKIVIPTPLSEELLESTFPHSVAKKTVDALPKRYPNELEIHYIYENTQGLSELYNTFLSQSASISNDVVIFMHDDVEIHDAFFVEKLKAAHKTYDVVGLAGSTSQVYSKTKPTAWHHCVKSPEDGRGFVSHYIPTGEHNKGASYYNSSFFGPTPSPVVLIDGLFISVNVEACRAKNVEFDKQFEFHHYDMQFCVNAVEKGLKIGVWPIFVVHHGLGEFANDPRWQKSHHDFLTLNENKQLSI